MDCGRGGNGCEGSGRACRRTAPASGMRADRRASRRPHDHPRPFYEGPREHDALQGASRRTYRIPAVTRERMLPRRDQPHPIRWVVRDLVPPRGGPAFVHRDGGFVGISPFAIATGFASGVIVPDIDPRLSLGSSAVCLPRQEETPALRADPVHLCRMTARPSKASRDYRQSDSHGTPSPSPSSRLSPHRSR